MKHSNPSLMKPSLGRINFDLSSTKLNKKDPNWYVVECPTCSKEWAFKLKQIPDHVIKCPNCGWEEVFFKSNFIWEDFATQPEEAQQQLLQEFREANC